MESTDAHSQLRQFLNHFAALPDEDFEAMKPHWKEVQFGRKEIITNIGQTERYLYFVLDGYQRSYYLKDDKDITIAFTYFPSFSGIPESFLAQKPSQYFLETLTPSRMLRISYEQVNRLAETSHPFEHMLRKALEAVLIGTTQRLYEQMALSTEEKFRIMLGRSGHLLNAIPHKYLASYLGMDATNFSKLLGKVKI